MTPNPAKSPGFTLIELLVVVAIIGVLSTFTMVAVNGALKKARDAKRKTAINQIGRFLSGTSCYVPNAGPGDYDIADLFGEIKVKYPQISLMMSAPPKDPRGGTAAVTKYRYKTNDDISKCVLYANLENESEPVTITGLTAPTPGGGAGVLASPAAGPNGSTKWFQTSN